MNQDELLARLSGFEWNDFECKQARSDVPKGAYTTVSAFANSSGGWLVFGVADHGDGLEVVGVRKPDKVQNDFLGALRSGQKLNRVITASPEKFEIDGKHVLAFHIPEAERADKPIYLGGNPHQSYIRRGAGDERCTPQELERFLRDASQEPFDGMAMTDVPVESCFDPATVAWYRSRFAERHPGHREIENSIEFLLNWNFVVERNGRMQPTRAGVLLFGVGRYVRAILPRPVLDYQRIDAPFDQWSTDLRWHDRQVFEENILQTWQGLVARYMRIAEHPFVLDPATLRRNDDPPDYVAFREAAINLLIHQDYGDYGRKASIRLFRDRTVFWNPGDAFATESELLDPTEKQVRNPSIVNAFRRIGLSDQAGTGIRAIFRNWHELGRVPPQLNNDKARKEFGLTLVNKPLVTDAMDRFRKKIGANLTQEQADTLALALGRPAAERISLTDIRALGMSTTRQARQTADHLVRQRLLEQVSETMYAVPKELRERLAPQVTPHVDPQVTPHVDPQVTPHVDPQVTPHVDPQVTPHVTPQITPDVTPQFTPHVTPQVTPQVTPHVAPQVTPQVAPQVTPHMAPQITPDVTPQVAPHVPPQVTPHVTPQVTPHVTPQVTPHVPPQVTPHVTPQITPHVTPQVTPHVPPQVTPHVALQVTPHVALQVTPHVRELLVEVSGEMTRRELMEAVGLQDRMSFAGSYLQPALEAGLLEMTIPDKPRSGKQRYRLTELGRAALDQGT